MPNLDLNKLKQYRNEILKAEIASVFALLNDKKSKWKDLINIDIDIGTFFGDKIIKLSKSSLYNDFIKNWRNQWDNPLKKYFNVCEILNSQLEKANISNKRVEKFSNPSNPFGTLVDNNFVNRSLQIFSFLDTIFKVNGKEINSLFEAKDKLYKKLSAFFKYIIADDRLPNNEVSLWDQVYTTTSLFKTLLVSKILGKDIQKLQDIQWRILGIQYDKMGLAEKGFKLASIKWYREIAEEIDKEIKKLLEVEYPIGNEIYRDETGIYFIVGKDLGEDLNDGSNLAKLKSELNELEDKILEIFRDLTKDEFYPAIFLTKASRGLMNLSTLLEKAKENFLKPNWTKKNLQLEIGRDRDKAIGICPICQTKLIYEKDKKRNNPTICEVCDRRIHHSQVTFWQDNISLETIWTSEIKDKNGRITYVSLKFGLEDWLNGDLLNTLLEIDKKDFEEKFKLLKKKIVREKAKRVDKDWLHISFNKEEKIEKIGQINANNILFSIIKGTKWEDWIRQTPLNDKINRKDEKIEWDKFTDENDPALDILTTLLLQFLLRKNPSPARLRRIWETTREFFEKIHKQLDTILKLPERRKKRLVWEVKYTDKIKNSGEELEGNGLLFWAQPNEDKSKIKIYLISSIRDFLEKYENKEIQKALREGNDKFLNEVLQNKENFKELFNNNSFKINLKSYDEQKDIGIVLDIDNLSEIHSYRPYSLITDISPINYQVIIPAENLQYFIDELLERYNREFKYVYGKLPIHIGIIVSDYKKPVYINLKALRKIRRNLDNTDNLWIDEDIGKFCHLQKEKLSYATLEEKLNDTESYYSLYFDNLNNQDYNFYIKPNNNWKYWISTIDKFPSNSKVKIIPNTFDFEFMDHNIRRKEIFYDEYGKRILKEKSNRSYELEIFWQKFKIFKNIFESQTSHSSLYKFINLLYKALQKEVDSGLLASVFINVLKIKKLEKSKKELFIQLMDFDKIEDLVDLNKLKYYFSNEDNIKLWLDAFDFWHNLLKEM